MKIILPLKSRRQDGVALLVTIIILLVGATMLASYLLVTESEFKSVARSQVWNSSMALTEAGVEDALAFMNKYDGNLGMVNQWSTDASASQDGWTKDGAIFTMHRVVDASTGYYDVTIDNTYSNAPVITCKGTAYWTLAARSPFLLATAGLSVSSNSPLARSVQVTAIYSALFRDAIDSVTNINLNGNNVRVDSFDSSNPLYSTWNPTLGYGTYNPLTARAHGNVATDSDIVGAINVGQANVYGKVNTGPGGTTTVGQNGYVGPLPQTGTGIQPGYSSDDMNVVFPDVVLPAGANGWRTVSDGGTITASGNYYMSSISSGLTTNAPNVNIYVAGSISISGQESITIGTNAANVNMFVAGPSVSIKGNGLVNNAGLAAAFGMYGLPSLTSIALGGNAANTGTIYAPEASFQFGGGGNNVVDFTGAIVVKSVLLNGHANFHYDETLAKNGPGRGYIPTSWKELSSSGN